MEQLADITNGTDEGEVRFTSLVMKYAYGQPELHPETAEHCNFQIVCEIPDELSVRMR